jgi:hypothetical protein
MSALINAAIILIPILLMGLAALYDDWAHSRKQ